MLNPILEIPVEKRLLNSTQTHKNYVKEHKHSNKLIGGR